MTLLLIILVLLLLFGGGSYAGYRGGLLGDGPMGPGIIGAVFLLTLLWLLFGSPYAMADDGTKVAVLPFYQAVEPYLIAAFGAVFSALLAWGLAQLQTRTGIRVSADARDRVQTAAVNAAGRILAAQEGNIAAIKIDVHSPLVAAEVPRLQASVGDAINQLGMTPQRTAELIAGKIGQLQAVATTAAPTVVVK